MRDGIGAPDDDDDNWAVVYGCGRFSARAAARVAGAVICGAWAAIVASVGLCHAQQCDNAGMARLTQTNRTVQSTGMGIYIDHGAQTTGMACDARACYNVAPQHGLVAYATISEAAMRGNTIGGKALLATSVTVAVLVLTVIGSTFMRRVLRRVLLLVASLPQKQVAPAGSGGSVVLPQLQPPSQPSQPPQQEVTVQFFPYWSCCGRRSAASMARLLLNLAVLSSLSLVLLAFISIDDGRPPHVAAAACYFCGFTAFARVGTSLMGELYAQLSDAGRGANQAGAALARRARTVTRARELLWWWVAICFIPAQLVLRALGAALDIQPYQVWLQSTGAVCQWCTTFGIFLICLTFAFDIELLPAMARGGGRIGVAKAPVPSSAVVVGLRPVVQAGV